MALAAPPPVPSPAAIVVRADADNPIVVENRRPDTSRGWEGPEVSGPAIEGYATEPSVLPGQVVHFHVSTDPGAAYEVQVYRLGWYGGAGGRLVATLSNLGTPQLEQATGTGADWPVTDTLQVPDDWVSGYYLVRFELRSGPQSGRGAATIVVVRAPPSRHAPILVHVPVNTWQAYNGWGGHSLYDSTSALGRVNEVSFERPYSPGYLQTFEWELQLVRFLEREGYDVAYQTDVDTHRDPDSLLDHRLILVAGHDEYWSSTIRNAFGTARDRGTNLAFLGANNGYWQVRYDNGEQTIVGYKSFADPVTDPALQTVRFRDLTPPRPECALEGVQWEGGLRTSGDPPRDYTVVAPADDPWLAGTGLATGSVLPGLVAPEWDTASCSLPGETKLFHYEGGPANADAVRYTAASGARVFSAGSLQFAWGLDDYPPRSTGVPNQVLPALQQFTRNALADLTRPAPPSVTGKPKRNAVVLTVPAGVDPRIRTVVVRRGSREICRTLSGTCTERGLPGHRTYEYSAAAVDEWSESDPAQVRVAVANTPPSVTLRRAGRTVLARGSDSDGDRLAYRWQVDGKTVSTRARRLRLPPGRYTVSVEARDGHGGRARATVRVS